MTLGLVAMVVLLLLKVFEVATVSWFIVFLPIIVELGLYILFWVLMILGAYLFK